MHEARNMHSIECRRKEQKALVHLILLKWKKNISGRRLSFCILIFSCVYKVICKTICPANVSWELTDNRWLQNAIYFCSKAFINFTGIHIDDVVARINFRNIDNLSIKNIFLNPKLSILSTTKKISQNCLIIPLHI